MLGAGPQQMQMQQQMPLQSGSFNQLNPEQQYNFIQAAYNSSPQNQLCSFRKMLYNVWQPGDVQRFLDILRAGMPGVNPSAWNQAMLMNPDPNRFVPMPVSSFQELHARVQAQKTSADQYKKKVESLRSKVNALEMECCRPDGPILTKLEKLQV